MQHLVEGLGKVGLTLDCVCKVCWISVYATTMRILPEGNLRGTIITKFLIGVIENCGRNANI